MSNLYWHFAQLDEQGHPIMRDGTLIKVGKRYEVPEARMCVVGFHGSKRAIDALKYAPGPWVSKRPLENVIDDDDKSVGTAFVQGPGFDATEILNEFARKCAIDVVDLWNAPDVVVKYLKTGKEELRVAAYEAARDAAWEARDAQQDTAEFAAWSAAGAAVGTATEDAAWATSWAASWAARDVVWEAAYGAARNAARATTQANQNEILETMLSAEFARME